MQGKWSCGHVAGAMCAECYQELARKAHVLAEECDQVREENRMLREALFLAGEQLLKEKRA